MGLLDKHRQAKLERDEGRARQEEALRRRQAELAIERWEEQEQDLLELLEETRDFTGATDTALILKKGELAYQTLNGAGLIEPRRLPGSWQGRSSGYSFHVAKGVNYRIGASRGTYKQGDEVPQIIDVGTITITNQRVVFQGTKASREWAYAKLLGFQHADDPGGPWTALQVSNRQKVSGFMYDDEHADVIRFRLALAVARFNDDVTPLVEGLEAQLAEHRNHRPLELTAAGETSGE